MAGLTVVDASVLIAYYEGGDAHHVRAKQALLDARASEFAASVFSFAEVLVAPARAGQLEAMQAGLRELGVVEVPLAGDAAPRLAKIRVSTGLKLPDCCVLLAAEDARADTVLTFDAQLAAAARAAGFAASA